MPSPISFNVSSIRLSTRPDYVNDEILDILSEYGVRHIELGVQSASDAVLSASKRGHTAECAKKALRWIFNEPKVQQWLTDRRPAPDFPLNNS